MDSSLVVGFDNLNPLFNNKRDIPQSQMFDIRESFQEFKIANPDKETYDSSQGDGGSSLPGVPSDVLFSAYEILEKKGTGYNPPSGSKLYRYSVIEDYWQASSYTGLSPDNVASCCGGRDALLKAYTAMQDLSGSRGGFVVVSQVPWISYKWGPYSVGSNALYAEGSVKNSWAITEAAISECVLYAKCLNREVSCLILTSPDNPTGRYTTLEEQARLAKHALSKGVHYVLFDWIYHWVSENGPYDINTFMTYFSEKEKEKIIVLDGITKSLGASNIRNAHLIADKKVITYIRQQASHGVIPGFYGEAVAIAAYQKGFEKATEQIINPINESRQIMAEFIDKHNIKAILDQGYYAFLNVKSWIEKKNMKNSADLGIWLARNHGLAIIPGYYFNTCASDWIRFSYALPPKETQRNISKLYELWSMS